MSLPVFDIVRGSFFDGPGIRTVVFLQGCPLKCSWCHNPESQPLKSCRIKEFSTGELLEIILRDRNYYNVSNGGVTFSGGEPLIHIDKLADIVKLLYAEKIHVAFDTSGYFDYNDFEKKILPYTELLLYDLKIVDSLLHKKYTGKYNNVIIRNLQLLVSSKISIIIRIPLIPQITANSENLLEIAYLMKELGLKDYEMVPYNSSCIDKLKKLNIVPHEKLQEIPVNREDENKYKKILDEILL